MIPRCRGGGGWTIRFWRSEATAGWVIILAFTCLARAQFEPQNAEPNLAIAVEPEKPYAGVPRSFVVSLTNTTTHIIRLPRPTLYCSNAVQGSFIINTSYMPQLSSDQSMIGRSCVVDSLRSNKPILDQVASWEMLLLGQSLKWQMFLEDIAIHPRPGTYTVSASYKAAYLSSAERTEIASSGIDIPSANVSSAKLTYTVAASRSAR